MSIPGERQTRNARIAGVLLLGAICCALQVGCATGPRLASPAEMGVAERAYIEDVPFHAQREHQCGPAALAMALNASGVEVTPGELVAQVFLPAREGSIQPEMLAAARRRNRVSFVLDGAFQSLLTELDAGHPVVVMQNLSLPVWPMWHYAVAIGYDMGKRRVILHSGEEANREESFRRFDATWARSERWAMVTLPPGELPASIRPDQAMDAVNAFEQASGADNALPAWRSITGRWPDYAMGWFALGNAKYAMGERREALSAFRQAAESDPELAAAWLNLGLLLEELEEYAEARRALERAASLPSPWRDKAEEALTRVGEHGITDDLSSEDGARRRQP